MPLDIPNFHTCICQSLEDEERPQCQELLSLGQFLRVGGLTERPSIHWNNRVKWRMSCPPLSLGGTLMLAQNSNNPQQMQLPPSLTLSFPILLLSLSTKKNKQELESESVRDKERKEKRKKEREQHILCSNLDNNYFYSYFLFSFSRGYARIKRACCRAEGGSALIGKEI